MGTALILMGIVQGDRVGVIGPNCPEWMLSMQAINKTGAICVPLYDSLGENAVVRSTLVWALIGHDTDR